MKLRYTTTRRVSLILANNLARGAVIGSVVALVVLTVCSVAFYLFENGPNPEVTGFVSALGWVTRTLLQGEPAFEPVTGVGAVLFYVVVVTGVGVIAIVTAGIASKLIELVMRKDAGMGRVSYEGHIVLCGWSPKGHEILRELHDDEVVDKRPVAIVAPLPHTPTEDDLTTFIQGSPSDADALRRAGIERAETAIILADDSNAATGPDERDAMTLLATLAVESLNPDVHTCVEVIRSANLPHFRRAKVDEVVVSAELTGNLLAASAVTHGLSRVVTDLTGHETGAELYAVEAPAALAGRPFVEALSELKRRVDATLVGIATDGFAYELNPASERVIAKGDRLLFISSEDPTSRVESLGSSA